MAVCVPLGVLWSTAGGTQRFSEKRESKLNSESLTIENNGGIVDDSCGFSLDSEKISEVFHKMFTLQHTHPDGHYGSK